MSNRNKRIKVEKQPNIDKKHHIKEIISIIVAIATVAGAIAGVTTCAISGENGQNINQQNVNGNNIVATLGATVNIYDHVIDLDYSNAKYEEGQELFKQAKYSEALECFQKAIEYHENNNHADDDTAKIQSAIGLTNKCLGKYEESIKSYTRAIGIQKSIKGGEYVLGYYYYLRAVVFSENHQLQKAENDLEESTELLKANESKNDQEQLYSETAINELKGVIQLQSAYSEHSGFDVGEVLGYTFKDSYNSFCRALENQDEDNKEVAEILINRATVLLCLQQYSQSIQDSEKALDIYSRHHNEPTDHVRDAYFLLATAKQYQYYMTPGNNETNNEINNEYYSLMNEALKWSIEWTGESFGTAKSYECLGMAAMIKGDYDDALELFKSAKSIHEKNGSDLGSVNEFISSTEMIIEDGGDATLEMYRLNYD